MALSPGFIVMSSLDMYDGMPAIELLKTQSFCWSPLLLDGDTWLLSSRIDGILIQSVFMLVGTWLFGMSHGLLCMLPSCTKSFMKLDGCTEVALSKEVM